MFSFSNAKSQCGPLTADDTDVCESTNIHAPANPNPGVWTTTGGANIVAPNSEDTEVNNLDYGPNTFIWTVAADNCSESITINGIKLTADAGPDQPNACSQTTLNGSNPNPGNGFWESLSPGVTFDDNTSPTAVVSDLPPGDTKLVWHVLNGTCEATDTMVVTNNTPNPVNAGADDVACSGDSIQLDGTAPPPGYSGEWTVIGGNGDFNNSTLYNTWVTNLDPNNINVFRWRVYNAYCEASDTVLITNNSINLQNFTSNDTVCTDVGNLSVTCPGPTTYDAGYWKVVASSGNIVNVNSCNTTVTNLNFNANTFRYIATKGTCTDSIEVTIYAYPVEATAAADVAVACEDSVNLYGNDPSSFGGTGVWSVESGSGSINNINSPTTYATGLNAGVTNAFTWTVSVGSCVASDTAYVEYDEPEDAIISNPDTGYSCNDAYVLNAVAPTYGSGFWTSSSPGVTYTPNSNTASVTVDNLALGNNLFVWHVTNGSCPEKTDTILVINQFPPSVDAGGPYDTVCNTNCINLSASAPPAGATGTWTAPAPITFDDPNSNTTEACNFAYGDNILTWTVAIDQCSDSDDVTIVSNQPDPAIAQDDFHVCSNTATINATSVTNGSGVWTSNDPLINIVSPNNNTTVVNNLSNGGNTFYWTVTNGACSDQDTLIVYNDSVSLANAGADQYICTDSAQLLGNTPVLGSGQWILFSGGANIDNDTQANTWVRNLARGENIFIWRISNGPTCFSEDTVSIFNLSVDAQINQANPHYTCEDNAVIVGNQPSTQNIYDWQTPPDYPAWGYWNAPAGIATFDNVSSYITTVRNLPVDTTRLVWTISNGYCSDHDTLSVINNMPTQANAGPDTIVCDSNLLTLHGNDPLRGNGYWNVLAGSSTVDNSTLHNSAVFNLDNFCGEFWTPDWWNTNPAPNIFEWVIEYNGCVSRDTVRVINGLPLPANAGPDETVCANETYLDALDEGSCSMDHWWEAIPQGPTFWNPWQDPPVEDNTAFNAYVEDLPGVPPGGSVTTFVWHKTNTFGSLVCELTDTVQVTALGYEEELNAGSDDAVCDTSYQLSGTPPGDVFDDPPPGDDVTGYWYVVQGAGNFQNSTLYDSWVHNMGYQTNIYRWTLINHDKNCTMDDDVYITNALPSNALCGPDSTVCEDQALLTANRPVRGTGVWTVIGGGSTIIDPTCQGFSCNTYAINLGPGTNTFLWTVTNEYTGPPGPDRTCSLDDTLVIENNEIIADPGNTIYICADTAQLNANEPPGTNGQWNVAGGSGYFVSTSGNTSSIYNDVVRNLTRGKNTFTWTINNGKCSDSDDLIVWNNLPNPDPDAGADQTLCADSATLTANSITRENVWYDVTMTDTLQWGYSTQGWSVWGTGSIDDPTLTNTWVRDIPPQTQTSFIWHAYYHFYDEVNDFNQTCELTDTVLIYNNSVTAEAGDEPNIICGIEGPGAEYQLGATQVTAPASGIWSAVFNPGPSTIVTPTAYDSWVTDMQNGDHIYKWTVSATTNGKTCSAYDTIVVKVRIPSTSTVALPDSFEVCSNEANLQANVPIWGTGHWEDVYGGMGNITDPFSNSTTVTSLWPGISKWAWVIDNDGCTSSDTLTVINNTVTADADDRVDPNVQNICVDTMNLSATDPNIFNTAPPYASGYWTGIPATITFENSTLYNTTVRNLSNSQPNILRWTIEKGGCLESSQLVINNNQFDIDADITSFDNHMYTCEDSINLAGEQPGPSPNSGNWNLFSGGGMIQNPTLYNTLVTNLAANDNYFVWTVNRNGCTAKDTVIVTNNEVTSQAGIDDTVCYDTTSLNAGVPVAPATGQWTTLIGPAVDEASNPSTFVSGLSTNLNQFIWTVTKGACTAKDTVNIWNNAPDPAIVEADKEVCSPSTVMTVTVPPVNGDGVWSLLNGAGTITNSTSYNAPVNNLNPGLNTFLWIVTKGDCQSVDTLNITNNQVIANAGPNDTVCVDNAQLFAVDPSSFYPGLGTGHWEPVGGAIVDNSTQTNTTVSGLGFGNNTFRWIVEEGGCSDFDDAVIVNKEVVSNASDIDECVFPVNLTGNPPVTSNGLWKNIGGLGTINNSTLYNSSYSGLDIGLSNTLRWIVYNDVCADSTDIQVTNNSFSVSAGPDQNNLCVDTTQLNGDDPSPGSGYWTVEAGFGTFDDSTNPNTIVRNLGQGTNTFRWHVAKNGCSNSNTVKIINNTPSDAIITGPANTESCDGTITLSGNHPTPYYADNQYWQQISGSGMTGTSTSFNVSLNNLEPGNNVFIWRIENGECYDEDTITIVNNQVAAYAGNNQTVCEDNTHLNATNPKDVFPRQGNGSWTNLSGPQNWIVNSTLTTTQVTDLPNGTSSFQWTVSLGGCAASDIVQITNNSVEAIASDESECGEDIQLNGNDPSTFGGNGRWTIISGSGSITNSTLFNTTITGVTNGGTSTLQWYVENAECSDSTIVQVTNDNFEVSAGVDDTVCSDTAVLLADAATPGTGQWSYLSGNATFDNSTINKTIVRDLAYGENVLQWEVTRGLCSNTGTVRIVNNTPSDAIITGPANTESCDGSVTLTANIPTPFYGDNQYWEQIGGSGLTGTPSSNSIFVNNLSINNNIFVWVIENGKCYDTDTITIVNNQVVSDAGRDDTVCVDSIQLHAVSPASTIYGGTGQWTNLSGGGVVIDDSFDPETYIYNLPRYSPTTMQWVVTKGNCSATDKVNLYNYSIDAVAYDNVACDTFATITAQAYSNPPETGYWTVKSPGTAYFVDDPSNNICDVGNLSNGTNQFMWNVQNSYCADSTTIFVNNNGFTVNADTNDLVSTCHSDYVLNGDKPAPGSGYWTKISGPGIVDNSTLYNSTIYNLNSTPTLLEWTVNKNGCQASDQVSIVNNGVVADASPHLYTCNGTVTLDGNNPNPGTGMWQKLVPTASGSFVTPSQYNTQYVGIDKETTVALKWVVTSAVGGCQDSVEILVTNNQFNLNAGLNDTTCSDTIQLAADSPLPGSGYWSISSGAGDFDNSTANQTIVRNIGPGDNVYSWNVSKNGCDVTDTVTITNNSVIANAGFDQPNLCADSSILSGNDVSGIGGTGTWSLVSGAGTPVNVNSPTTKVVGLSRNDNTFRWTVNARGCSNFDEVTLTNNSFDVEAGLPQTVCADTAQLNAIVVPGGSGNWTPQGGTPATIDDPTYNNTIVRGLQQGTNTFQWTVSRDGCVFSDDVVITNDLPNPPQLISTDVTICVDSVQLQAVAPEAGTNGTWSYTGSGGDIQNPNSNNTWALNLNYGTTEFIWTVKRNSCELSDSFFVTNDGVTANAGGDQLALCQDYASLNAVNPSDPATGYWTKADAQPGIINNTTSNVTDVNNLGYGTNLFVWNVNKGICGATDTVRIINNSASKAEVGSVLPSCTGSANLSATPPLYGDGTWNYIGTYPVQIVNSTNSNTIVNNLEYGANLFSWTVTNVTPYATCTDDTTFTVENYEFEVSAGNDQILCDTITNLEGETRADADSMSWEIITGTPIIDDSTDPNSQIIIGEGKSTVLKWYVSENGCDDDDYVTIKNDGVTATAYADEVCDSSTQLSAVPPASGNSGYWTCTTPGVTYTPNSTTYNANVDHLQPGANLFTWHLQSPNCVDSTTVNINYLVPYADAGPSISICDDSHVLDANDPSLFNGTGHWELVSGSGDFVNSTYCKTTVNNIGQGNNKYRWIVQLRGCSNYDDVIITNNNPTISVGVTQNICQSNTVLTGNNPSPNEGIWTKETAGSHIITSPSVYNTTVTGMQPGTHIFRWTVWNSYCTAYEKLTVNNNSIVADAGADMTVCSDSARLGGSLPPNASGYWDTTVAGPIIQNSTLYNTWVTNLNEDNNLFTWTVSRNGCSNSDDVIVTNNAVYVDAGDDIDICKSQTTLYGSNTNGGSGIWTVKSGSGNILNSTANVTNVNNIGQGANVFKWTVTRGQCSNEDEVIINNNEVYASAGSGDNSLCDTKFELNAVPAGVDEIGSWSVTGGAGVVDVSTDYNTWVRNLARGENILRWTVTDTLSLCSNEDEVSIINVTPTQAVTAPDKEICDDFTTITGNIPVYGEGVWEKVTGPGTIVIVNSTSNSTVVQNLGSGPNKFEWVITDPTYNCSTRDTIEVINSSTSAFAGLDNEACVDTFKLQASIPNSSSAHGQWTKVSSYGTFDDPTLHNTIVRNMGMGPNTYRWTVYDGICSAMDEVVITNNTPTVANAGSDKISCDGTTTLIGSTPDLDETGLWENISGSGNIENTTRYWTGVTGLSNGANRFTWQITRENCTSIDTVVITNDKINVYAGEDQEVCTDSAYLIGNDPTFGNGIWLLSGGSGTIINSTNNETPVIGLASGVNTFKWQITKDACSDYDEVQIINNEPTTPLVCYDTIYLCDDYTNLCANLPPDGETGFWTLLSGDGIINDSDDPNTLVTDLSYNSSFTWTIQKGKCEKSDTTFIDNGSVQATVSNDTIEFCGPDGTLSANNPLEGYGYWELISGTGVIDNSTSYITDVSGLSEGANTFRWTVVDGDCSDSDDLVLLNNLYPASANLAATNPICQPEAWVIGNPPDAGATGTWSFSAGIGEFDDIHASATRAYNIGTGTNTVRWTITKGSCENFDEFNIINKTITASATSPVVVCSSSDTAQLIGNDPAPGTGYWELVSGSAEILNSTSFSSTVTNVDYGSNSLKWRITNGSCSDSAFVVVQNNFFTVTAGNDRIVCDTSAVLSGTNPGAGGSGIWTVAGGQGVFENSTSYSTRVNGLIQGDNTFTWSVSKNGCTASDDVTITNGLPNAEGGGDKTICTDSTYLSATQPSIGSGQWTLTGGSGHVVTPSAYNSLVRNIGHGQNTFRWTVTNGQCIAYDDITIYNYTIQQTAGDDQNVCDTFTTLSADPPGPNGSGYWTIIGGGGNFQNSTLFNTLVNGLHDGVNTYAWTVTANGCSGTSQVQIFNNRFDIYAGEDQVVTAPNATLEGESVPPPSTGIWTVTGGGGTFADPNDPTTYVDGLQYGVNTFTWTVNNPVTGCSASDDVNIVYNGFDVDAGPTQYICSDTTTLDATDVQGATTFWRIDQGSCVFEDITEPNTRIYDIMPGQTILKWNVTKNGFTNWDTVSIYNYKFTVDAGADQHLCSDSAFLNGSAPENTPWVNDWSGEWSIVEGGGNFSDKYAQNTKVNGLASDTNIIKWSVERDNFPGVGVCKASDNVNLIYHKMPNSDFDVIPMNAAGCPPFEPEFINTTSPEDTIPGTVYKWIFAGNYSQQASYLDTVSYVFNNGSDSSLATYSVKMISIAEVSSGLTCRDTVVDSVTVYPDVSAAFSAYPTVVEYPSANIGIQNESSDTLVNTYSWEWGDGSSVIDHHFEKSYNYTYDYWGTYTMTLEVVSNYGCIDSAEQVIRVIPAVPTSGDDNNVKACSPLNIQLYANVNYDEPGESDYRWVIIRDETSDTVDVLTQRDPIYTFTEAGTYFAKFWATGEGSNPPWSYTFIRTDTIVVWPVPVADFEVYPTKVMENDPIHCYNYSENASEYFWDFGLEDSTANSTEFEPIFAYTEEGDYYISLLVKTDKGCTDKLILDVPVSVLGKGKIKFPNAFVPDRSGPSGGVVAPGLEYANTVFKPALIEGVVEYDLQIFNRWGEFLFQSTDPEIGWDGYIDGELAPQDVYVFKCRVVYRNGEQETITGSVTLLR